MVGEIMTSAKKKGDQSEREALAILESQGWTTIKSPRTMKRVFLPGGKQIFVSQSNDFFNLFDLIAKQNGDTLWIQVKGAPSDVYKAKPSIADFQRTLCCKNESCQIWLRVPRKGFILYKIRLGDTATEDTWSKNCIDLKGNDVEDFMVE